MVLKFKAVAVVINIDLSNITIDYLYFLRALNLINKMVLNEKSTMESNLLDKNNNNNNNVEDNHSSDPPSYTEITDPLLLYGDVQLNGSLSSLSHVHKSQKSLSKGESPTQTQALEYVLEKLGSPGRYAIGQTVVCLSTTACVSFLVLNFVFMGKKDET